MFNFKNILGGRKTAEAHRQALYQLDAELANQRKTLARLQEAQAALILEGSEKDLAQIEGEIEACMRWTRRLELAVAALNTRVAEVEKREAHEAAERQVAAAEAAHDEAIRLLREDYVKHARAIAGIAGRVAEIGEQIKAANEVIGEHRLREKAIQDPAVEIWSGPYRMHFSVVGLIRLPDPGLHDQYFWPPKA